MKEENKDNNLSENKNNFIKSEDIKLNSSNEIKGASKKKLVNEYSVNNVTASLGDHEREENKEGGIGNVTKNNAELKTFNIKTNEQNETKNKSTKKIIIFVFIFILLIVAGLCYFLYLRESKDYVPAEVKSKQQIILDSSIIAMNNVKSNAFQGDISFNININKNEDLAYLNSLSAIMDFDGQIDRSDSNDNRISTNVRYGSVASNKDGDKESISADFSILSFGKVAESTIYFKLNDIDLGEKRLMYNKMITPYKNKNHWYFLDEKELQETRDFSNEEDKLNFEKMIEEITSLYQKYNMIEFKNDLGDESIDGRMNYHYQIEIDSEAMFDFYVDIVKVMYFNSLTKKEGFTELKTELEKNRKEMIYILDEIMNNIKVEVWIDKEDTVVNKIKISGKYNKDDFNRIYDIPRTKSNMLMLIMYLRSYYRNNNSYDGFEITKFRSNFDDAKNINIITNNDSYLIWSDLAITTDKYCVDSSGSSKFVYGDVSGTRCDNLEEARGEKREVNDLKIDDITKEDEQFDLDFEINLVLSNFNEFVNIEKPVEAENFIKAIKKKELDYDYDGLSDDLEVIYGTDPKNPDTDGDGYKDGKEVYGGYDPLVAE